MSMLHQPGVASRFDKGVDRVREILRTVEPGRPVMVVALAAQPQAILRTTAFEPGQAEALLQQLSPTDQPLNLETGLQELRRLVEELKCGRGRSPIKPRPLVAPFFRPFTPRFRFAEPPRHGAPLCYANSGTTAKSRPVALPFDKLTDCALCGVP